MRLIPPPNPEWVKRCIEAAEQGERWPFVCYDSRCQHGLPPHPLLGDCPWFGPEPSSWGFDVSRETSKNEGGRR